MEPFWKTDKASTGLCRYSEADDEGRRSKITVSPAASGFRAREASAALGPAGGEAFLSVYREIRSRFSRPSRFFPEE